MFGWLKNLARVSRERPRDERSGTVRAQAGIFVDPDSAMQSAVVWACVRVIAETIAALPWHVYRQIGETRERVRNDIEWLLHMQPNPEVNAFTFREVQIAHALLRGNAYAEIERNGRGDPAWLWPLHPDRVQPLRLPSGDLVYRVRQTTRESIDLPARDVLHFKGLGFDGISGYSVIRLAAQSIGLGLAMEQFGASFFGNGAAASGVLEHPGRLSPDAHSNLRTSLEKGFRGVRALRPMILEEGMKWHQMSIAPEEAQFLESRRFQTAEICRWFRVPPHMVQDLERATFSNIEHQGIEFVQHTIVPWARRLEMECDIKLFGAINRGTVYTRLDINGLMRGDIKSRYDAYAVGRQWGWLSANDIRTLEDLNPVDGGDEYLAPMNMVPADMLRELADKPEPPPSAPPPEDEDEVDDDPDGGDSADEQARARARWGVVR